MKGRLKFISLVLVIALLFSIFIPTIKVLANASTNSLTVTFRNNYTPEQGKVQYSLDDGATWQDITSNTQEKAITVTGNNFKIRIVAEDGYSIDLAGIEYRENDGQSLNLSQPENGPIAGALMGANGYQVDSNVNAVTLNNVEFRSEEPGGPGPGTVNGPHIIEGGTLVTGNFTYSNSGNGDPADIWLNDTEIGVGEPPAASKDYYYVESTGEVTFTFGAFVNNRITSIKINNTDYSNQLPQTKDEWLEANQGQVDMVNITVPYAATYNIQTTTTRDFDWSIGNFLWSYMEKDKNTDNYIGNGTLRFVSLQYKGNTYNSIDELEALNKPYMDFDQSRNDEGGAVLPAGAKLTVELVPKAGYQLTEFTCNGQAFETQEQVGYYTFDVPAGNFHWGATFSKVDDVVKTNTQSVESGTIELGGQEDSMAIGTARLDVSDKDVLDNQKGKFEDTAGDYKISKYLDISLFNTVYKGSANSSWDTSVTDLDNEATISLKLDESINAEDVVLIHEKHDGTCEKIDTTYNAETKTHSFKTNEFSTYAIAIQTTEEEVTENTETVNTSSNPKTGDNIIIIASIFVIATLGAFITIKSSKKQVKRKH